MELLNELLQINEAATAGRAWQGKLKKIDALLSWMYDKDILTKGEKADKDRIFRGYYRYYNDGDMPSFIKSQGFSTSKAGMKYQAKEIEAALEKYLNDFISKTLSKYAGKIDRKAFKLDKLVKDLSLVKDIAERHDGHGLYTYWLKTIKLDEANGGKLKELAETLEKQHDALTDAIEKVDPEMANKVVTYARTEMKGAKKKTWTNALERQFLDMTETCDRIANLIGDALIGIKKLQALHALKD